VTILKRRILDLADGRYWALYGMCGVVEFNVQDFAESGTRDIESRAFVGIHAPKPHPHDQGPCAAACPFLEGPCFIEMSDAGAVHIAGEWEEAGFDDEVIWRWLAEYHADMFA
jgi:hypothetical protein